VVLVRKLANSSGYGTRLQRFITSGRDLDLYFDGIAASHIKRILLIYRCFVNSIYK